MPLTPPRVFVSYSHDDADHIGWVGKLCHALVDQGVSVQSDDNDPARVTDWGRWMSQGIAHADVLIPVCTPRYKERFYAEAGGVPYEGRTLRKELLDGSAPRIVPVLREGTSAQAIPADFGSGTRCTLCEPGVADPGFAELITTIYASERRGIGAAAGARAPKPGSTEATGLALQLVQALADDGALTWVGLPALLRRHTVDPRKQALLDRWPTEIRYVVTAVLLGLSSAASNKPGDKLIRVARELVQQHPLPTDAAVHAWLRGLGQVVPQTSGVPDALHVWVELAGDGHVRCGRIEAAWRGGAPQLVREHAGDTDPPTVPLPRLAAHIHQLAKQASWTLSDLPISLILPADGACVGRDAVGRAPPSPGGARLNSLVRSISVWPRHPHGLPGGTTDRPIEPPTTQGGSHLVARPPRDINAWAKLRRDLYAVFVHGDADAHPCCVRSHESALLTALLHGKTRPTLQALFAEAAPKTAAALLKAAQEAHDDHPTTLLWTDLDLAPYDPGVPLDDPL